jgi:hypothetical protein
MPTGGRLWSEADFARFQAIAESPAGQVESNRIRLPAEVKTIDAWFIAGIRIDPGAPGLAKEIIEQYGQQPQIRFIVQPVTQAGDGKITVHDIAGHMIFSFSTVEPPAATGCLPRLKPDMDAFRNVVRDVVALRDQLASGQFGIKVETVGPLNVHPGLTGATAKPFRDALKQMLEKHLVPQRLTSMAIMALDAPEPWIFVAMQKVPQGNPPTPVFVPVPGPTLDGRQVAQMLSFRGGPHVRPAPATNNQNPISCRHAAFQNPPLPNNERKGVSTADLFDASADETRVKEVVDIIADPGKSHFFNTDCVSCHTDTRQAMQRIPGFNVPEVAADVLPQGRWNVRNFGWFPPSSATATRRTATETAEVVGFINKELLGK